MKFARTLFLLATSAFALSFSIGAVAESWFSPYSAMPCNVHFLQRAVLETSHTLKGRSRVVSISAAGGAEVQELAQTLGARLRSLGVEISTLTRIYGAPVSDGSAGGHVHPMEYVMEPAPSLAIQIGEDADGVLFIAAKEPTVADRISSSSWIWFTRNNCQTIIRSVPPTP
ncbi:hypothetical protein [Variovorax paradoxus]|uniref:hypothetical protein n=1 Tax=Variovorax paradoxus TaxID=34073 RepID=UPI003D648DE8